MPKLDQTEWEAANESSAGEFKVMEPGIYPCIITGVQTEWDTQDGHVTSDEKQCVRVLLDVAEGEFKGEFSDGFYEDKPYAHCVYMSWKPSAYGMLKHTFHALDEANPGFDSEAAFTADQWMMFIGKKCLASFNGTEYTSNRGDIRVRVNPDRIITSDDEPKIKVKLENGTKVDWDDYASANGNAAPAKSTATPAAAYDDSDVPF